MTRCLINVQTNEDEVYRTYSCSSEDELLMFCDSMMCSVVPPSGQTLHVQALRADSSSGRLFVLSGTFHSESSSWWLERSWTCRTRARWGRSWAGTASPCSLASSSTDSSSSRSSTLSSPGRTPSPTSEGCCRPWWSPWPPPPGQRPGGPAVSCWIPVGVFRF